LPGGPGAGSGRYESEYSQLINASLRGALDACLQNLIASFCSQCSDGGLVQGYLAPPDVGSVQGCDGVGCFGGYCGPTGS
jgi:hypothetical protein